LFRLLLLFLRPSSFSFCSGGFFCELLFLRGYSGLLRQQLFFHSHPIGFCSGGFLCALFFSLGLLRT